MKKNKKFIKFKDCITKVNEHLYAIDDDNEIHVYDIINNDWNIV